MTEPSLAVVVARLDDIVKRLDRQDEQRELFVLKETYLAAKEGQDDKIAALNTALTTVINDRKQEESWRRNVNVVVLVALAGNLVTVALAIFRK